VEMYLIIIVGCWFHFETFQHLPRISMVLAYFYAETHPFMLGLPKKIKHMTMKTGVNPKKVQKRFNFARF